VAALPVFFMIGQYMSREQMIRDNLGTVDFTLIPFDWAPGPAGPPVLAGMAAVPQLSVSVFSASADLSTPADPIPQDHVRILPHTDLAVLRRQRILAPGGAVFLRIQGRGRPGQRCAPSWIRILQFPGFRTDDIKSIAVWVPTCDASAADTVEIESGGFIYGGPGEPRSKHYGETDYTAGEQTIELAAFAMDRTEVSNARYAPFRQLSQVTGHPAPVYYNADLHVHDADPRYPVSYLSAFEAEAYCAYMGKRLPSDHQWAKAARGGLSVGGTLNPHPRRLYPWGVDPRPACVNSVGPDDGFPWTAPVDAFACGSSPYGILQLGGNVQEWIARDGQSDPANSLHVLRGGAPDSPLALDHATTIFRNPRPPRAYSFANGVRCVTPLAEPSQ
jgi:eukaryotic-like serine/threonine-protein kinase